jgi:hypothetical protein
MTHLSLRRFRKGWFYPFSWLMSVAILGCMASSSQIKELLEEAAKEDLKIILADLPATASSAKLHKPYFIVDEYEEFQGDTALVFQARAKLVFFYLDASLDLCQIRKYRFKRAIRSWERYENELKHIPQKYLDTTGS